MRQCPHEMSPNSPKSCKNVAILSPQIVDVLFVFIHIPASNVKKEFFLVWGPEKVTFGLFEE
jgi:hypothetical protein